MTSMKKRLTATLLAALLCSSALTGCAGPTGGTASTPAAQSAGEPQGEKPASLNLVYQYWDFIPDQEKIFADFGKKFKEANGIDVTVEGQLNTDANWQDTLKTQIAAGSGPDVFHMDVNQLSAWKDAVIQPLSPYFDDTFWGEFVDAAKNVWKVGDTYYAASNSYSTVAFLYNKTMLKDAGVTLGDSWTVEELEASMQKLSDFYKGKTIKYTDGKEYPYYVLGTSSAMYYLWLFNGVCGGTPLDQINNIAQQAYVDAVARMGSWADKGWLIPSADVLPGKVAAAFPSAANVAYLPTGDWTPTTFYRQDKGIGGEKLAVVADYASIPAPIGKDGKPFSEIYNQGVVMNKNLSGWKAKAAAELIRFMTTGDAWIAARGPEVGGLGLPAKKEWADQYATTWFDKPEQRSAFIWTAQNGTIGSPDYQTGGIEMMTPIQDAINAVLEEAAKDGEMSPDTAKQIATKRLEESQALINVQLEENGIKLSNPDAKIK